jgi:hypothetical protein
MSRCFSRVWTPTRCIDGPPDHDTRHDVMGADADRFAAAFDYGIEAVLRDGDELLLRESLVALSDDERTMLSERLRCAA